MKLNPLISRLSTYHGNMVEKRSFSPLFFPHNLEHVWQYGNGCFPNNFLCHANDLFLFLKKLFLIPAHQNDSKYTNHIKF